MKNDLFETAAVQAKAQEGSGESAEQYSLRAQAIFRALPGDVKSCRVPDSVADIGGDRLLSRLQALVSEVFEAAFVKACASAISRNLYREQPGYQTRAVLLASADLQAKGVVEQWTQAPKHYIANLSDEQKSRLVDVFFSGARPSLSTAILEVSSPKNLYIAAENSDTTEGYLRRAQIIIGKVNPLFVVLDADVVGTQLSSDSGAREIFSTLGIGGFYISAATKDRAAKVTPMAMSTATGACGCIFIRSDGVVLEPGDLSPPPAKIPQKPSATTSDRIKHLSENPPVAANTEPPTQAAPNPSATGDRGPSGSQAQRFAEIRKRQERKPQ